MIFNAITITRLGGGDVVPKYKPIVDFEGVPTTLAQGNTVDYTDLSTVDPLGPPITQWSWTFEGGVPQESTVQNPQDILYQTPGTYDVTLLATNADGTTSLTKTDYITVNQYVPPTVFNSFEPSYFNTPIEYFNTNTSVIAN